MIDGAAYTEGRRPKASRGGNRAGGERAAVPRALWRYGDLGDVGVGADQSSALATMQNLSEPLRPLGGGSICECLWLRINPDHADGTRAWRGAAREDLDDDHATAAARA